MLPSNKAPWGLICKNDFLGGDLYEGEIFGDRDLLEDLRYVIYSNSTLLIITIQNLAKSSWSNNNIYT